MVRPPRRIACRLIAPPPNERRAPGIGVAAPMIDLLETTLGALAWWQWLYAGLVVFAAGYLRGFTGFGFALAAVPALTLILEPREMVPAALLIQTLAGLQLLPKIAKQADGSSLRFLLAGAALGIPLGVWLLSALSADAMRAAIGAVLLVAVYSLWRGFRLTQMPGRAVRGLIGFLSGLLNGGTAMGGPPVIVFFLALPTAVVVGRASLLLYFFFLSLASVAAAGFNGLLTARVLIWAVAMFPLMALGNWLGDRRFDKSSAETYRRFALIVLCLIALLAIGRALGKLSAG